MNRAPMFTDNQAEWICLQVKEWYANLPELKEDLNCERFVDDIIIRILEN